MEVVVVVEGEEVVVEEEGGVEIKEEEREEEKQLTLLTQVTLYSACLVRLARCWMPDMTRGRGS